MMKLHNNRWTRFGFSAATALTSLFLHTHKALASIIPSAPTYTSPEFTAIQTEMADIVLALGWGVVAVVAVIAVTMIFKAGKKALRKLNP